MRLLNVLTLMLALSGGNLLYVGVSGAFADATCQVLAQYTGTLTDKPVFTGAMDCSGQCAQGDCVPSSTDAPFGYTAGTICACPSGGGSGGCYGTLASKVVGLNIVFKLVCSSGGCEGGKACDWIETPAPAPFSGKFAKCACQPSTP